ncbi:electron transfer flavoprotein subunit alpha/FixB family protein [Hyphomonas sp. WL0036]|uniref:electron transfer flavoprotein subunit alpha/FixB family protein n=1 Tax=Hyphomonas sediminis TaxID=2866160 RepID=UPI001C811A6E|nr:electron transfer flavoprotein subunit alpha/FixB family protein [Hyphomonas sediminis]MBY9065829.1 electron transfer flavoprotein subunit alpha/FixB family protein [Hyphomonas sediminis]
MAVLVVAEHHHGALSDATHKVVTAATKFGGDIDLLVAGENAGAVAPEAAKIAGVRKVLKAEGETLRKQTAEAMEALIVPLMAGYDAVFFAATTTGKNIAPRVAAKLDVMQISEIIGIEDASTFVRPIYAGNAIQTVKSGDAKKVITVRGTAFPAAAEGGSASVEDAAAPAGPFKSEFVSEEMVKSDRPELAGAKRVVSGGRALGSSEKFQEVIFPLADKLGAAVGASRAAVDAGYAPNDYQVGQTGKIVAPELYIAVGISGAIQHLAGMKDSKIIVAINKDEEAPIFQVADYGLVADLFVAVPELTNAL